MLEKTKMSVPETSDQKNISSKRHRGVVLFLLILALAVMLCFFLWRFLQRPAVGIIRPGKLPQAVESFDTNKERKHYSGKYMDFSYSALYLEKRHDLPVNGPIKEGVLLSTKDVEGRKIALVLADRGSSDLESEPSFQMRLNAQEEYIPESITTASFRGTLFRKNTQIFEVTAFFPYRGHIISVSITSPFGLEGLEAELSAVVESLRFSLD